METPAQFPLWPLVPPELGVRRYLLRRFPYAVAYLGEVGQVVVLAVAHTRREPLYWMVRR